MNKKYDFGIVIGRFQPFHLAHQDLIKHSLSLSRKSHNHSRLGAKRARREKSVYARDARRNYPRLSFPQVEKRLIFRAVRDYPYNDHVWTTEIQNLVNEVNEENETDKSRAENRARRFLSKTAARII
jgi:bifunctional NMN adenylyltransferase/nudix hydrolase